MACPPTVPPPTLPLPPAADPPREQELRAQLVGGVGATDDEGSIYSGGAVRGTYAPLQGMLVGVELGGGARRNSQEQERLSDGAERETVLSGRLLVGYGLWLWGRRMSIALEAGLTPGLHSEYGGFVGPDVTLSVSGGGRKWWVLTATYRLAYMVPSRADDWSPALSHLGALTVMVPRRARYAGFLQLGVHYGHRSPEEHNSFGLAGVLGFRFAYGYGPAGP
jgi:hypothetical protein